MRFSDLKLSLWMILDIPALRYNFSFIGDSDTLFYHQESHKGEPIIERETERQTRGFLINGVKLLSSSLEKNITK
jgi:hypothetical protein